MQGVAAVPGDLCAFLLVSLVMGLFRSNANPDQPFPMSFSEARACLAQALRG